MAAKNDFCPVDDLPDEILLKIFTQLALSELLLSARPVCQRWMRLSKDESLWINIDIATLFQGSQNEKRDEVSKGLGALFSDVQDCVERITFNNVPLDSQIYELFCCPPDGCQEVTFPKLNCLDYSYSSVSSGELRRALSTYYSITELILIYTRIPLVEAVAEALHLPNLKKFIFHEINAWEYFLGPPHASSRDVNSKCLVQIPRNCPQLEWVEIYTMWTKIDDSVIRQFLLSCPNLTRLYFTWSSRLTVEAFENISRKNFVTHLGMADRQGERAYLYFVFPFFPNLVSLTIAGSEVYRKDCIALGKSCPNLQELIFDVKELRDKEEFEFVTRIDERISYLTTLKLQEIVRRCHFLRKVHAPCSEIDDDGFSFLLKHSPHLEDVNFMCCSNLTATCLQLLSKYARNIKYVNFKFTFLIPKHLHACISNCLQLREIILDSKAISLREVSLMRSAVSSPVYERSPSPEVLDDEEFPFIDYNQEEESSESINDPLSSSPEEDAVLLPKDTSLNIYHYPVPLCHCHVTMMSLRNVTLSTSEFESIFLLCPDLIRVNLDGCLNVTGDTIEILLRQCHNLKILRMSGEPDTANSPCFIGDHTLREICKYSRNLQEISILYNRNITHRGVACIMDALDSSLRQLRTLSFCTGPSYKCKLDPDLFWWSYLTKKSATLLEESLRPRKLYFRILHLDFVQRTV